tara:strand:+ start:2348 stop:2653 length:306 start_codon:yes stop_codon:yes gene_type:complete
LLPKPGYPGDDPTKVPLAKTYKVVVRDYGKIQLAVVGAAWPAGAHSHLVEAGHKKWLWGRETNAVVPGKFYFAQAVDETGPETDSAFRKKLKDNVDKASNG